jgi:hypothetical protein
MRKILFFCTLCFSLSKFIAQVFNGSIEFKYATQKDTSKNIYHVKNKLVKLDQHTRKNDGSIEGSFLFNLETKEVKFINPKRKLWGSQKSETPQVINGQCVVTKGKTQKTIAGYKCTDYTVKNTDENTSITYWIAEDKFNFFIPLIKLWNRKDKQSIYFGQIKNLPEGSMPLMSEEKQLDNGKALTKLEVTKVTKATLPDEMFNVPKEYTKLDDAAK